MDPRSALQEIFGFVVVLGGIFAALCFFGGKTGKMVAVIGAVLVGAVITYTTPAGWQNIGEGLSGIPTHIAGLFG